MSKILIKESDLIKLIETAMDLDIYNQPSTVDSDNGNLDIEDTIEDMVSKLEELLYMIKQGKKIEWENEDSLFKQSDTLNQLYEKIKYEK
jgi:hypothetical protein